MSSGVAPGAARTLDEAAAFVGKWRAREPEMAVAEVFCPPAQRLPFALWGALAGEWRQAALELSDPNPTRSKCGWWAEEAILAAQGQPRHPLTIALARPALPWAEVARALLAMAQADDARPADVEAAMATVAPLAAAIVAMEAALFDVAADAAARRAVAVHLLGERLRIGLEAGADGRLPLALLARHGLTGAELATAAGEPALCDWAATLRATQPAVAFAACLYRQIRTRLDRCVLGARGRGPGCRLPPLQTLFAAWSGARQARRVK